MPVNEDAATVYMATRGQIIAGASGPIDLSIPSVKIVMDLYGIKDQRECLTKVMNVWRHFENERRMNK